MQNDRVVNLLGAFVVAAADEMGPATNIIGPRRNMDAASLNFVGHAPGISIDDLSRVLSLSQPATVRLVDRLVDDGLLERRHGRNYKTVALHLSSSGNRMRKQLQKERYGQLAILLRALDGKEQSALELLLEKMILANVRDMWHAGSICRFCDESICRPCPMEQVG